MLKTVEGILHKGGQLELSEEVECVRSQRVLVTIIESTVDETLVLTEPSLSDWHSDEENEAWESFQPKPAQ